MTIRKKANVVNIPATPSAILMVRTYLANIATRRS